MQYMFLIRSHAGCEKYVTRLCLMTYFSQPVLEHINNTYCMGKRLFLYFYAAQLNKFSWCMVLQLDIFNSNQIYNICGLHQKGILKKIVFFSTGQFRDDDWINHCTTMDRNRPGQKRHSIKSWSDVEENRKFWPIQSYSVV